MIVRVLGSAAGGGVPQWNCACANCNRARIGESPARTQSSVAVSRDGVTWILVNASVDISRQLAQTPSLWPLALRENPFAAVLLTDANVDHTAGLGELRQNPDPLVILSSRATKQLLVTQLAYERFDRAPHHWIDDQRAIEIDSLDIEIIDVPGLLPGYAGRTPARGAVVAYVIRDRATGAQVTIAPVFSDLDERLHAAIADSDLALLDGTFYSDRELHESGVMAKDARWLGHAPVGGSDGTLARIGTLATHCVFVHLNNTNPMLDPLSEAYATVTSAGCKIAEDGWQVSLGGARLAPS